MKRWGNGNERGSHVWKLAVLEEITLEILTT